MNNDCETWRRFCDSSNVCTWYVRACRLVARAVSQPVAVLAASSAASTPHPLSSWQQRALHTAQLGHDTAAAAGQDTAAAAGQDTAAAAGHDTAAAAGHDTAAAAGHGEPGPGPWVRKIWMRRVCCISLVWSLATSHSSYSGQMEFQFIFEQKKPYQ